MGSLERPNSFTGTPEVYGASVKINDQIIRDFEQRGHEAARVVLATLTETPHTPEIDGIRFEVEVSNVYKGYGDDSAATVDTVDEMRAAFLEFREAEVPGSRGLYVPRFRTRYRKLLGEVMPGMFDSEEHTQAFEEVLVEDLRGRDVPVQSPKQAIQIVKSAPRTLRALSIEERNPRFHDTLYGDGVTTDGRIVTIATTNKGSYDTEHMPQRTHGRGGRAPRPVDRHKLEQRIIELRTEKSKR